MKKTLLITISFFVLLSCSSDELTKSKAKKIINACLEQKPEQKSVTIMTGEVLIGLGSQNTKDRIEGYKKLADQGFLKVTLTNKKNPIWKETKYYHVELTDKAKPYIYKIPKATQKSVFMNSYKYVLDNILEIHETPATNTARVKAQYKLADITPFAAIKLTPPKETIIKTLKFTKTSDGWKYCDNH